MTWKLTVIQHHRKANDLGRTVEITEGILHSYRLKDLNEWLKPIYSDNAPIGMGLLLPWPIQYLNLLAHAGQFLRHILELVFEVQADGKHLDVIRTDVVHDRLASVVAKVGRVTAQLIPFILVAEGIEVDPAALHPQR